MLLAFYWVIIGLLLGDYWAVIGLLGYPQAYHSITNSIASATFGGSEMPPLPLHSCPSRRHPFLFSGMPCRFLPSSITPALYAVFSLRSPIRHSCRCWILCIVPTDSRRFLLFPDIRCRSGDPGFYPHFLSARFRISEAVWYLRIFRSRVQLQYGGARALCIRQVWRILSARSHKKTDTRLFACLFSCYGR